MKTMKLFIVNVVVLLFAVEIANAQEIFGNKIVWSGSYPSEFWMPCVDEYVVGEETYVITVFNNASKVQRRYKGTWVGMTSGKTYTSSVIEDINWQGEVVGAYAHTVLLNQSVECEGVPILVYKTRFHFTFNASGFESVRFEREDFECL